MYAFARRVDDIGDGTLPVARKAELLAREAELLDAPPDGDLVLTALADARERFGLPLASLHDLIDGVRMDVEGDDVRDLRGARRLLPARGRLDRAPVRRGLRHGRRSARRRASPTTWASRCS